MWLLSLRYTAGQGELCGWSGDGLGMVKGRAGGALVTGDRLLAGTLY